jgi:hypothetical protein
MCVNERGYIRRTRGRRARQKKTIGHRIYENLKANGSLRGLMRNLQEVLGRYEPRRGKTTTKKAQKPRTHLFISLTISISNHIQSPIIPHVGSTIVQVDHSTIHIHGNDARGTTAENTSKCELYRTSHFWKRGNRTITRRALCLGPSLSAEN